MAIIINIITCVYCPFTIMSQRVLVTLQNADLSLGCYSFVSKEYLTSVIEPKQKLKSFAKHNL